MRFQLVLFAKIQGRYMNRICQLNKGLRKLSTQLFLKIPEGPEGLFCVTSVWLHMKLHGLQSACYKVLLMPIHKKLSRIKRTIAWITKKYSLRVVINFNVSSLDKVIHRFIS